MLYTDFEKTLESRLGTRADLYPHATEYHRVRFEQTIHHLLHAILKQAEAVIQQSDVSWTHTEEIVSDILHSIRLGDGVPNTVWESNLAGIEAPVERR